MTQKQCIAQQSTKSAITSPKMISQSLNLTKSQFKLSQTSGATETLPVRDNKSRLREPLKKSSQHATAAFSTKLSLEQPLQKKSTYGQPETS